MKKMLIMACLFGTMFLSGCHQVIPKQLLPQNSNDYSLLIISKQEIAPQGYEKWERQNDITNVQSINFRTSSKNFKYLKLTETPAYVVFDSHGVVFKTYSEANLIKFLHHHNPN